MTTATATPDTSGSEGKPRRQLRFGVDSDNSLWTNGSDNVLRIQAVDLRDLANKAAAAREDSPHAVVVVDIDVMIAQDIRTARAALRDSGYECGDRMVYVGTAAGLAGLVADIHALGIADGAVLVPVAGDGVLELIRDVVVPELTAMSGA